MSVAYKEKIIISHIRSVIIFYAQIFFKVQVTNDFIRLLQIIVFQ